MTANPVTVVEHEQSISSFLSSLNPDPSYEADISNCKNPRLWAAEILDNYKKRREIEKELSKTFTYEPDLDPHKKTVEKIRGVFSEGPLSNLYNMEKGIEKKYKNGFLEGLYIKIRDELSGSK